MTHQDLVRSYHAKAGQVADAGLYSALIDEEYIEWDTSQTDENELKELADLMVVIRGYCEAKGWDIDQAFIRVMENNIERMYQDDGTIHRREDGKIMKNVEYPKVNLKDLV